MTWEKFDVTDYFIENSLYELKMKNGETHLAIYRGGEFFPNIPNNKSIIFSKAQIELIRVFYSKQDKI